MKYHYYNEKIENLSILELKELLDSGSITSEQLIWAYVERIAYIDKQGPKINAVREINPDVFSIAEERDYQRKNGEILGPLHGIPILLKDCINTKDKTHTTCGAMALKDYYAENDAFIVELLRKAGAIILGKATMSEWYGFIFSNAVSGFNGLSGPAKNPYGPGILPPGGSSGGCAAAVSADMTAAAIGTETSGSIIEPAYFCSVVGFKPTAGLISRSGILPVTMFQDAPGFLTKNVADAALLLNILAVRDKDDSGTWRADKFEKIDIPSMANEDLKGKKIGVIREGYFADLDDEAKDIYEKSFNTLRQSGAEVIDIEGFLPGQMKENPEMYEKSLNINVMCNAFKVRLEHYLSGLSAQSPVHTIEELIEWNKANPQAIPYGQDYLEYICSIEDPCMNADFVEARWNDIEICGREGVDKAFEKYQLDALIMPGVSGQGIAPRTGNPIITIPIGYSEKSGPVGLNLIGRNMEDEKLLRIATTAKPCKLKSL